MLRGDKTPLPCCGCSGHTEPWTCATFWTLPAISRLPLLCAARSLASTTYLLRCKRDLSFRSFNVVAIACHGVIAFDCVDLVSCFLNLLSPVLALRVREYCPFGNVHLACDFT